MSAKHTPEDWGKASIRRTEACVMACAGIPTEALEAGVVLAMRHHLEFAMRRFRWPLAERMAARTALLSSSAKGKSP